MNRIRSPLPRQGDGPASAWRGLPAAPAGGAGDRGVGHRGRAPRPRRQPAGTAGRGQAQMSALKASKEATAGEAMVSLGRYTAFPLSSMFVRLAFSLPQREIVTVTTNVPGPRQPLYALGRRLVEIIPYVPIATTLRTGISIFTYCGNVTFGITGDYATTPDIEAAGSRHRGRRRRARDGRRAPRSAAAGRMSGRLEAGRDHALMANKALLLGGYPMTPAELRAASRLGGHAFAGVVSGSSRSTRPSRAARSARSATRAPRPGLSMTMSAGASTSRSGPPVQRPG